MSPREVCPAHTWATGRPYCYEVGPEQWNGWKPSTSPRWEAAVKVLRELLAEEGWDRVSSAYAEVTHRGVLTEFQRPLQLRPSTKRDIVREPPRVNRPWEDHTHVRDTHEAAGLHHPALPV